MADRSDARNQFGASAETYLTSHFHSNQADLEEYIQLVGQVSGRILDVGTGAGHTAYAFANHAETVVAYDLTPEMLSVVERTANERGVTNIETVEGRAEELPFDDASFDGITCRVAAHHFHDVAAFVREAARVVKPGGWLLLVDTVNPADTGLATEIDLLEKLRDPSHVHSLSIDEWSDLFGQHGWSLEHVETRPKDLDFQDWVERMRVPLADRQKLRQAIFGSEGSLKEVLRPTERDGRLWFSLPEGVLLARR